MADLQRMGREAEIVHALRGVIDPEIGLNVVDVGLIYSIDLNADGLAIIRMTTTTRGCPAAGFLQEAIRLRALETGVTDVRVELTYDPPWSPDRMKG